MNFSLNIQPTKQYGKLQQSLDIIFTIFRLVGGRNMRFDDFQIFEYIQICEYFLQIIFLFIVVTQDVKNDIHICIHRICLLRVIFIFVFVHQKIYFLHFRVDPGYEQRKRKKLHAFLK